MGKLNLDKDNEDIQFNEDKEIDDNEDMDNKKDKKNINIKN